MKEVKGAREPRKYSHQNRDLYEMDPKDYNEFLLRSIAGVKRAPTNTIITIEDWREDQI